MKKITNKSKSKSKLKLLRYLPFTRSFAAIANRCKCALKNVLFILVTYTIYTVVTTTPSEIIKTAMATAVSETGVG